MPTGQRKKLLLFWVLFCFGSITFEILAALKDPPPASRPNIIFLLADDLGYGDLGCYGHPRIRTPHLDRLAVEGLKLTHAYAAAPVCSPSRAALLTGRYPYRLGIRDWIPPGSKVHLARGEIAVSELLKNAGYRTAICGKWHVSSTLDGSEPTPDQFGFDHWFCTQNNAAPNHLNPKNFIRNGRPVGELRGNSSQLIVEEGLRFLEDNVGKPVFLFLSFHAPHELIAAPANWVEQYSDLQNPDQQHHHASIALMDHAIGRLLKELAERKHATNTLVVFTSDNGPEAFKRYPNAKRSYGSAGGLRGMKLHLYEGGCRVPAILHWPGRIPGGTVIDQPVHGVDFLPTFCEVAGVRPPLDRPIDGISITPFFRGETLHRSRPLYWQYDQALSSPWTLSIRQGPWKLLSDASVEKFELYHLVKDPAETNNLAGGELDKVRTLSEQLRSMHREIQKESQ